MQLCKSYMLFKERAELTFIPFLRTITGFIHPALPHCLGINKNFKTFPLASKVITISIGLIISIHVYNQYLLCYLD